MEIDCLFQELVWNAWDFFLPYWTLFGEEFGGEDYARFEAAETEVRRTLRRQVSLPRRILGFLLPFLPSAEEAPVAATR